MHRPQGNCKSVIEALIMANNVHEEDVSYHEVGSPRRFFSLPEGPDIGALAAVRRSWSEQD